MNTVHLVLIFLGAVAITAWAMNIWGGWAEKIYEASKDATIPWFWLRVVGVEV